MEREKSETTNLLDKEKEPFPYYDSVIVSPGYESYDHRSALFWDTRVRLLAAALLHKNGNAGKIIVGGGKLYNMDQSFAGLMENVLTSKFQIPGASVVTEETTRDTASQIKWIKKNIKPEEKTAFITDPAQAKHVRALVEGFGLDNVEILSCFDVVMDLVPRETSKSRFKNYFNDILNSDYWQRWSKREKRLADFTKYIDKQGRIVSSLSKLRENKTFNKIKTKFGFQKER